MRAFFGKDERGIRKNIIEAKIEKYKINFDFFSKN